MIAPLFAAQANKNADGKRINTGTVELFQSETLTLNSFRGLDYARCNESIIYFTDLCYEKAPICKLSRSKAPKHRKLGVTDIRQKPANFFCRATRALALALTLLPTWFLCKSFRSCRIYNSLLCCICTTELSLQCTNNFNI